MNDRPPVLRVLHLEDSPYDSALVKRALQRDGLEVDLVRAEGRPEFERILDCSWDVILADFALPDFDGLAALELAQRQCPHVPFIFVSGALGEETAVEALKRGATDYVLKDRLARLPRAVRRSVAEAELQQRQAAAEKALRVSEEELRATFEQAAVGIVHVSPDGRFIRVNQKFCEMLGFSADELAQKTLSDLSYPADRNVGVAEFEESMAGRRPNFTVEKRYVRRDGVIVWVRITASSVRDPQNGKVKYNMGMVEDINERKAAEERLQQAQAKLHLAAAIAMLGFWEVDLLTREVYLSPDWKKQIGYGDDELPNRYEEWESRVHPEDRAGVMDLLQRCRRGEQAELDYEYRLRHKDGSYRWIASRTAVVRDESGAVVRLVGTHLDITSRKEAEERIRQVSQHDPLTGLPNRALLYEFAEHLLSSARRGGTRTAFLFVDLDRFKPINDTYGHAVGDDVLREVARRLDDSVRDEDLVGRLGGDEFLAVLSHIRNEEDAARAARHTLEHLGRTYRLGDLELAVSPSIGISMFPQDGQSVDELIKAADAAMYHAKQSGRNNFQFFKQELNERTSEALRIESRLRKGLEQSEFELHYQPVVDTETGAVVGAEALLRWPLMNTEPDQFIAVAETTGIMPDLGGWVLREVCRQLRAWRDDGLERFPVAINVSATQFRQKDFTRVVGESLAQSGIDPAHVRVEVTESTVMKNVQESSGVLRALQDMGVGVALDDFGVGFSSLSQLGQLPIDAIKLDRSFVHAIGTNRSRVAVAGGIIALGQSLGLEVIAEGIESEEAVNFLREHRCHRGQGFHFCRPMPAAEFAGWCRQRVPRAPAAD